MFSVYFRFTVSYARFGDTLPAPDDVNTTECNLCKNTIYVFPEAIPLFECGNPKYSALGITITVMSTSNGGGNHTIMIIDDRRMAWDSTPAARVIPTEGMMCKYASH